MSLLGAFAFEPLMINQPLLDSLLQEADSFEVYLTSVSGVPGSGTITDPYDASNAANFDAMMNSLMPNTTVHLDAGVFLTKGHADGVSGGWQPKRGMRIIGEGLDVTTIKLVSAATNDKHYFAIGADDTAIV